MSSRENILGKVSKSKPSIQRKLIKIDVDPIVNIRDEFEASVGKVGGNLIPMSSISDWKMWIKTTYGTGINIYSE